jgi:hypothetical protein
MAAGDESRHCILNMCKKRVVSVLKVLDATIQNSVAWDLYISGHV